MDCSTWWSQLPNDLKENALGWLPVENLRTYRNVCNEWNSLFQSTKFITNDWLAAPPNTKPWLVVCHDENSLEYMAYNFFTNTWKRFSLSFLKKKYPLSETSRHISGAGLLLSCIETYVYQNAAITDADSDSESDIGGFEIVSNPLTGTSLELPDSDSESDIGGFEIVSNPLRRASLELLDSDFESDIGFEVVSNPLMGTSLELPTINDCNIIVRVVGTNEDGQNGETYTVIAVVMAWNEEGISFYRVEIYDSCLKSWSTAGHISQNFHLSSWSSTIVISEDLLYCNGWEKELGSVRDGILAFNIQNGTSIFMLFPLIDVVDADRTDVAFSCGSRVFIGTCIYDFHNIFDIIIFEIEKPKLALNYSEIREMREIARIPPSVLEDLKRDENIIFGKSRFEFQGTSDLVCITYGGATTLLVYSLSENMWRWLPERPMAYRIICFHMFLFEPRPHMKVE